ncbi:hypothetical protein [Rhizobium sp. BK376]|uniref:hypothetical protein n=1 Tax=Rhizobium sp. BK376 TaxID=2512149 RepID=UPI001FDFC5B9|nr:hypothetical protein [Rhizobium sp. BK376]
MMIRLDTIETPAILLDRTVLERNMALVHRSLAVTLYGAAIETTPSHRYAFQTQCCPPSSYRQDEVQGDELGRIRSRPSPSRQSDVLDNTGSVVVLAGAEADDTRRPASLF